MFHHFAPLKTTNIYDSNVDGLSCGRTPHVWTQLCTLCAAPTPDIVTIYRDILNGQCEIREDGMQVADGPANSLWANSHSWLVFDYVWRDQLI